MQNCLFSILRLLGIRRNYKSFSHFRRLESQFQLLMRLKGYSVETVSVQMILLNKP